jgi:hypothetical protein
MPQTRESARREISLTCRLLQHAALAASCIGVLAGQTAHSASEPPAGVEWRETQLESGVRLLAARVADATHQSFFVFFPLHLANDAADRAQFSHLIEHHLVRMTDPGLTWNGDRAINGETTDSTMRLDATLIADDWREGVERVAAWLGEPAFNKHIHDRELAMIAQEEAAVVPRGYTHKFALAAWNQIVRHGRAHAAVHGDIQRASFDDAREYATRYLPLDERVMVATVGPVDIDEVFAVIRAKLAEMPARRIAPPPASVPVDRMTASHEGTWDLPVTHVMRWWPLPEGEEARAIGLIFQFTLHQRLQGLRRHVRHALPHAIVPTPEGDLLMVNISLTEQGDPEAVLKWLDEMMMRITEGELLMPQMSAHARRLAVQLRHPPDFAEQRERAAGPMRKFIEAQWMLNQVNYRVTTRMDHETLADRVGAIDNDAIRAFVVHLHQQPTATLVLRPRDDGDEAGNPTVND